MENELKELLQTAVSQQAVIYKKLDDIERKLSNSTRMASLDVYARELKREADKLRQ
jgi:hypothetical protein